MEIGELNERLAEVGDHANLSELFRGLLNLGLDDRKELDGDATADAYDRLLADTNDRHLLLVMLAIAGQEDHLYRLVERLVTDPPSDWESVAYALSPLMQRQNWDSGIIFPRLLDALSDAAIVVPALDLANFVARNAMVDAHPAAEHVQMLAAILGEVVGRLGKLEEDPQSFGNSVEIVQRRLAEAIALCVSLCDALGLIGDSSVIGKLNQALQVRHRRVQSEAAGALTRLGDVAGRLTLIELADEPSARLRVLAYAEELGIMDEIPEIHRTDEARAIAELAIWLAQPSQVGIPPTKLEVLDRRWLFWPSYSQPVDCMLIRFNYELGSRQWSNVGIVGPVVHAMSADMANLPVDDIYATYAGWHAEHTEIFEVPDDCWNSRQRDVAAEIVRFLEREGFESIRPAFLGLMLDEHALVVQAEREGKRCVVASDGLEIVSFGSNGLTGSLQVVDVWCIFKGRRMLRTFNSGTIDD